MSTSTTALQLPGRTFDRRPPWVLLAAAAIGAAIALSVSTLAGNGSSPASAPAARPAAQAPAIASETSSAISSLRPFSDASLAISTEQSVPAIYHAGVLFNYPGGTVRIGANGVQESVQAKYASGAGYIYPGGSVTIGAKHVGAGNENAPAVANCHQCR
jgi:hypothetical protein